MNIRLENFSYQIPGNTKSLFYVKNFEIPFGKKILIRGPSGCGKSSFLHALSGLIPSARGKVEFDETSLLSLSDSQRTLFRWNHLGLVFQKLSLIDHFTLTENLLLERDDTPHAEKVIREFGLEAKSKTLVRHLSLGEQQRVAIARVLMKDFSVLMADEPTSSLDDESSKWVMGKIFEKSKGKTLLCVSHDHRLQSQFDQVLEFTSWSPR